MAEFVDFGSDLSDDDINFASVDFPEECSILETPCSAEKQQLPAPQSNPVSIPIAEGWISDQRFLKLARFLSCYIFKYG